VRQLYRGERRVGVAINKYRSRPHIQHDLLKGFDHATGIAPMPTATEAEVGIGLRQAEFVEKHLRHAMIVMLAGMHEVFREGVLARKSRESSAALMNCGRAPTTVKMLLLMCA